MRESIVGARSSGGDRPRKPMTMDPVLEEKERRSEPRTSDKSASVNFRGSKCLSMLNDERLQEREGRRDRAREDEADEPQRRQCEPACALGRVRTVSRALASLRTSFDVLAEVTRPRAARWREER